MALGMAFLIVAGICAGGRFGNTQAACDSDSANGQTSRVRHATPRQHVGNTPATHRQTPLSRTGSAAVVAGQESTSQRDDGPAAGMSLVHDIPARTRPAAAPNHRDDRIVQASHFTAGPAGFDGSAGLSAEPYGVNTPATTRDAVALATGSGAPLTGPLPPLANAATPATSSPQPSVAAALYANLSDAEFARMGAHAQATVLELGAYAQEATQALDAAPPADNSDPAAQKKRITAETNEYLRMTLGYGGYNQLCFLAAANRKAQASGVPTISPSGSNIGEAEQVKKWWGLQKCSQA